MKMKAYSNYIAGVASLLNLHMGADANEIQQIAPLHQVLDDQTAMFLAWCWVGHDLSNAIEVVRQDQDEPADTARK